MAPILTENVNILVSKAKKKKNTSVYKNNSHLVNNSTNDVYVVRIEVFQILIAMWREIDQSLLVVNLQIVILKGIHGEFLVHQSWYSGENHFCKHIVLFEVDKLHVKGERVHSVDVNQSTYLLDAV